MDQQHYGAQHTRSRRAQHWWWLERFATIWESPLWSMLGAFAVYTLITVCYGSPFRESLFAYYNYLADALLHGQFYLREMPIRRLDLSVYADRYYLYWGPLPALLLLPFVAVFGVHVSDILVTLCLGAINVGLIAILLRQLSERGVIRLAPVQRGLLVLFFAFGTVHVMLAPYGRVWFTSQLLAFGCVTLVYLAAITQRGWWAFILAGLVLAGALLTRNAIVLAGIWPAWYLIVTHWSIRWRRLLVYALLGVLPIIAAVVLTGAYNAFRFGSPFETGIAYHRMELSLVRDYERYGAFNLHYLPTNLFYQYIAYPFPLGDTSFRGGSLFLLSPVFFAVFGSFRAGHPRWSVWALIATVLVTNIPILLLMGTGWPQFGPRYTLDFTVPLLLLAAIGVRRWPLWLLALLVAVSVGGYLVGAVLLGSNLAQ